MDDDGCKIRKIISAHKNVSISSSFTELMPGSCTYCLVIGIPISSNVTCIPNIAENRNAENIHLRQDFFCTTRSLPYLNVSQVSTAKCIFFKYIRKRNLIRLEHWIRLDCISIILRLSSIARVCSKMFIQRFKKL